MITKTKAMIVFQTSLADLGAPENSTIGRAASSGLSVPTGSIPVMFNPAELTDGYTAQWHSATESSEAAKTYVQTKRDSFSVQLFFDTTDETGLVARNVKLRILPLRMLLSPTIFFPNAQKPPVCHFIWGSFVYTGHITNIKEKYTLFSQEGFPLRAEVTVTFDSSKTDKEAEKDSSWKNSRNLWTVRAGDRLDLIAFKVYGDASRWPLIAEENDIANPLEFPRAPIPDVEPGDYGRVLALPDL